jgi:hypothetical protein
MISELSMKIDRQILDSVFLRPQESQQAGKASQAGEFEALLKTGQEQRELNPVPPGLDDSSAALWANSLLGQIQAGQASSPSSLLPVAGVEDEIGGVLDILEKYASALGDPSLSLKQIAPMADQLGQGASRLDQIAAGLGQDDPIKSLTSETAVLAAVEALKFKRGDFV